MRLKQDRGAKILHPLQSRPTKLGDEPESPFANMHVEKYRLLPGSNSDLAPMYEGAAQALLEVGVPDEFVQKFERGCHRNSK